MTDSTAAPEAPASGRAARAPSRPSGQPSVLRRTRVAEAVAGWLFVAPNLLLLLAFLFVPLGWAAVLSLQKARSFGPASWAGLDNYRLLLGDPVFWRSLLNTAVFTLVTVPLSVVIGLLLAVALDKALPARRTLRTIVYLPIVISSLVTALVGLLMFDESVGVLDGALRDLGWASIPWQTNGPLAMTSLVLMTLWTRVGFAMLIYLAALQDIPQDVLDAASTDGASTGQRFRRVVVPMLASSTLFLVVVNVIWSFQIFDIVYVMTQGGPGYSTSMLVTYGYDLGFGPTRNFGYGATVGVALFVLTLAFTLVQLRLNKRVES